MPSLYSPAFDGQLMDTRRPKEKLAEGVFVLSSRVQLGTDSLSLREWVTERVSEAGRTLIGVMLMSSTAINTLPPHGSPLLQHPHWSSRIQTLCVFFTSFTS